MYLTENHVNGTEARLLDTVWLVDRRALINHRIDGLLKNDVFEANKVDGRDVYFKYSIHNLLPSDK